MQQSDVDQVNNWFTYHAPTDIQREKLEVFRHKFRLLALDLVCEVAPSRERSIALTELRTAAMLVNQAIIFSRGE